MPSEGDVGWGLPRYVNASTYKELPAMFKRTVIREDFLKNTGLKAGIDLALEWLNGMQYFLIPFFPLL